MDRATWEAGQEAREAAEYRKMLETVAQILSTPQGRNFFMFLFKSFEVGEFPQITNQPEPIYFDKLGFMRAGNAIFKLAAEADSKTTGELLAKYMEVKREQILFEQTLDDQTRRS